MIEGRDVVLVYRDRIAPRSEAAFLRRQYLSFERLKPVWVGCRTDEGLGELGVEPLILGREGLLGGLDRALFKQLGTIPPQPELRELRPRLVHAQFGRGGALALPIARALRIPLVVTFHGGDATKQTHYRRRLFPTIYQRRLGALQREASAFVCVSDFVRDRLLERGFPPGKLRVIRLGAEIDAATPPPSGRPCLLFVGRFVEKKGAAHLIEAARLLKNEGRALQLVLVGDGPLLAALRQEAQGAGAVEFPGWLPNAEVRRRMAGALAVVVPSVTARSGDSEGLPTVAVEAMAEGTPVIGTREGGIAEAVEDGRTGLLVRPADPRALADAVGRLLDDPATRQAMGIAARERAQRSFDARAQSRLLEDLLLSVSEAGSD
ncbi:MAG TPA: glycosyltransferase [Stellaceae bacterium]|nr:glycosyltransferase [Stellaceae bacterium]